MIEAVVMVWLLWIYDDVNNLSPLRNGLALQHAQSLLHLEMDLHLDPERALNVFTSSHHLFAAMVSNYYNDAHFVVTLSVLVWLWARHADAYRPLRSTLVWINLIGFVVFWLWPMAPPRMLPGFIDTVAATGADGSFHGGALASQANQLAAMPSLHVAWAVWAAIAIRRCIHRRAGRALAAVYPAMTVFAVLATANHLIIDSSAGIGTAIVAVYLSAYVDRVRERTRRRWPLRLLGGRPVGRPTSSPTSGTKPRWREVDAPAGELGQVGSEGPSRPEADDSASVS